MDEFTQVRDYLEREQTIKNYESNSDNISSSIPYSNSYISKGPEQKR
ncbi:MAG: hypothetical protein KDD03_13290 [Gelidibacter sp.]|nr:hypothetical protein [Gelidibacter sp.]